MSLCSLIHAHRRRARPALVGHSEGFTLIELLVALVLASVVLLGVMAALDFSVKSSANENARNDALSVETTAVARMVSDLRNAYQVNAPIGSSTSSYMDVLVRTPGVGPQRLFYNCTYKDPASGLYDCARYVSSATGFTAGTIPGGVTPSIIVPRVLNETASDPGDPVFSHLSTPSSSGKQPTFGTITVHTPSKGELSTGYYTHQVVISNDFYLRQLDYGK